MTGRRRNNEREAKEKEEETEGRIEEILEKRRGRKYVEGKETKKETADRGENRSW